jgi:putative aldouronate transport system permease protein
MKKVRLTTSDRLFDIVVLILSFVLLFIVAYPLWFVIIASFSNAQETNLGKVWLWPKGFNVLGYERVLSDNRVWLGYRNTIFYTVLGTFISLSLILPAAYALSRKDLKGRNIFMMYFVVTMFFSGGLIPTYLTVRNFGLLNTFWVLVVPFAVSVYHIIIARTFFASTIPLELLEASKIDGCSDLRFFVSVVLPLSSAIIAVLGLYCAVGHWNQFFLSLIYVRDQGLVPLQMVLRDILLENRAYADYVSDPTGEWAFIVDMMKYSLIIIATVPVMCIYPFIQKYFTKGVMIGAIKG